LDGAQTDMVQQVSDTYNLTKTRIREDFYKYKTNYTDLRGYVRARGKAVRFIEHNSTFNYGVSVLKAGGVSAKILRNGTREKWPRAFFAIMPNGSIGFFQREKLASGRYAGRLPITQLTGPAVESAFSTRQYPTAMPTVENKIKGRMDKNMGYQIDFELSKF
jgi:hypothetical protein